MSDEPTGRGSTRARLRDPSSNDLLYAVGLTAKEVRSLRRIIPGLAVFERLVQRLDDVVLPQIEADEATSDGE